MAGTVKKLQFSEGTDVGAPTDLGITSSTSHLEAYADDAAYVVVHGVATSGDVYLNTTINKFRHYLNGAWRNDVPESDSADPTKTFLVDISGNTTAKFAKLAFANTIDRTVTFPDATFTVTGNTLTQTLTNKTIDAGLLSGGSLNISAAGNFSLLASLGANTLTVAGASSTTSIPGIAAVGGAASVIGNVTVGTASAITSVFSKTLGIQSAGNTALVVSDTATPSKYSLGAHGSGFSIYDEVSAAYRFRINITTGLVDVFGSLTAAGTVTAATASISGTATALNLTATSTLAAVTANVSGTATAAIFSSSSNTLTGTASGLEVTINPTQLNITRDFILKGSWTGGGTVTERLRARSADVLITGGKITVGTGTNSSGGSATQATVGFSLVSMTGDGPTGGLFVGVNGQTATSAATSVFYLLGNGQPSFTYLIGNTTGSAANVFADPTTGLMTRSTSSLRYKQDVVDLTEYEAESLYDLRPVSYRSKATADDPKLRHLGFIAEDVHEVEPKLVQYNAAGQPESVQYDRMTVLLQAAARKQREKIRKLFLIVTALSNRLDSLESLEKS